LTPVVRTFIEQSVTHAYLGVDVEPSVMALEVADQCASTAWKGMGTTASESMAHDVREIANAVLDIADEANFGLTNMALNKIVYFAHAWYLATKFRPLVDSPFEAWQFGPVHPQIYRQLKSYNDCIVETRLTRIDLESGRDIPVEVRLDHDEMRHVDRVVRFYGGFPAAKLVRLSHEPGAPWDQVWKQAGRRACPGMIISDALTESHYRSKLRAPS
jgi:uncharacterized phage-associated protein